MCQTPELLLRPRHLEQRIQRCNIIQLETIKRVREMPTPPLLPRVFAIPVAT